MKILILVALMAALAAGLVLAGGRSEPSRTGSPAEPVVDSGGRPLGSDELQAIIAAHDDRTFLVDVRTAEEYRAGAIPSAINIPYDVIQDNLPTQDRSARIIVYCRSGSRSGVAARTLASLGFTNVVDFGGIGRWSGELVSR